jgi:hypothetical protein
VGKRAPPRRNAHLRVDELLVDGAATLRLFRIRSLVLLHLLLEEGDVLLQLRVRRRQRRVLVSLAPRPRHRDLHLAPAVLAHPTDGDFPLTLHRRAKLL